MRPRTWLTTSVNQFDSSRQSRTATSDDEYEAKRGEKGTVHSCDQPLIIKNWPCLEAPRKHRQLRTERQRHREVWKLKAEMGRRSAKDPEFLNYRASLAFPLLSMHAPPPRQASNMKTQESSSNNRHLQVFLSPYRPHWVLPQGRNSSGNIDDNCPGTLGRAQTWPTQKNKKAGFTLPWMFTLPVTKTQRTFFTLWTENTNSQQKGRKGKQCLLARNSILEAETPAALVQKVRKPSQRLRKSTKEKRRQKCHQFSLRQTLRKFESIWSTIIWTCDWSFSMVGTCIWHGNSASAWGDHASPCTVICGTNSFSHLLPHSLTHSRPHTHSRHSPNTSRAINTIVKKNPTKRVPFGRHSRFLSNLRMIVQGTHKRKTSRRYEF